MYIYSDDYDFNKASDKELKEYNKEICLYIKSGGTDQAYFIDKAKKLYNYLIDSRRLENIIF